MIQNPAMNANGALDWNATIDVDNSFPILPEGDYEFEVVNLERAHHNGSERLPACAKAILTIRVTDGMHTGDIKHTLFLHTKCSFGLTSFFTGIGQCKPGGKLTMNWGAVPGSTGRCHVVVEKYTSSKGNEFEKNTIKKFYDPSAFTAVQTPTPWTGGNF